MPLSYSFGGGTLQAFGNLKPKVQKVIIRENTPQVATNNTPLQVVAIGQGTLSYQWYFNDTLIEGATTPSLVDTTTPGIYTCVVSNNYGTVTSQQTVVTPAPPYIGVAPVIITQPTDVYIDYNEIADFSVFAIGAVALNYQWYENGIPVESEGSSIILRNDNVPLYLRDGYTYQCKIYNTFGEVFSDIVKIKFKPKKPLVDFPEELFITVVEGNPLNLSIYDIVAYPDFTVDWYMPNGQQTLVGAQVTIPEIFVGPGFFNYGNNIIQWKVYNIAGFVSGRIIVNVISAQDVNNFYITRGPISKTITSNINTYFDVEVSPTGLNYQYRWFVDGEAVQSFDENNSVFNYSSNCEESVNTHIICVEVKYGEKIVRSGEGSITLQIPPLIISQPTDQSGDVGDTVIFSVDVCSSALYTYQWYRNGVQLQGAKNKDLVIVISSNDMHLDQFYCAVSLPGEVSQVSSDTATLTVLNYS